MIHDVHGVPVYNFQNGSHPGTKERIRLRVDVLQLPEEIMISPTQTMGWMAFFDSAYRGTPPRDIGRPRKEFVELVRRGEITGSVLDSGAGPVSMPSSLHRKDMRCGGSTPLRWRSGRRRRRLLHGGLTVHFQVINALELFRLNRKFDTATDSGLFPALSDEDRPIFMDNLAAFCPPSGNTPCSAFPTKSLPGTGRGG